MSIILSALIVIAWIIGLFLCGLALVTIFTIILLTWAFRRYERSVRR